MDKTTPTEDKSSSSDWRLTQDESKKLYTHLGGCIVAIAIFALLLYWLIETFNAWW